MANTGNTQQQINYGAAANDGQGDPLRTAFIKTDDNFDAIWNAGPVGSNITIVNNTVQSNNTNGNIVLRPNGVGMIQANAAIVPNATNLRDLGSADLRFRAAYIGTGGLSVDGNVTVTGNLTAGNISYTGNVFVGDLQGSVFADDSTVMVDAIDNEMFASQATFGQANVTGNVAANYFIGNGSLLTGVASSYGNANVADYLISDFGAFGSNAIVTAGNIVASVVDTGAIVNDSTIGIQGGEYLWQFAGNILRSPEGGTWQSAAGTEYISSNTTSGFINLVAYDAGNLATELFMEHGFVRIRVDNGGPEQDWNFRVTGVLDVPGDIIPQANATQSLGNATNQWANISANNVNTTTSFGLPVFANSTVRDNAISSPQPGMMVFVTGTGLQVRGATTWNTVAGTAT